ncbi:flagellar brake protein [Fusibacter sp. JL298sf-3]
MNLSEVLKPAHSVEMKVPDPNAPGESIYLKTMLESGYEDGVIKIIVPIYNGRSYAFHVGDTVAVLFKENSDGQGIYSIPCTVQKRLVENNMPLILVAHNGKIEKVQRRQAFRIHVYNTYTFEHDGDWYELESKDISSTGMLALTSIKLQKNDVVAINFDANIHPSTHSSYDRDKRFEIECKVLDTTYDSEVRKYYNRLQFQDLTAKQSKWLLQYLYNKQTEMIHLNPEHTEHPFSQEELIAHLKQESLFNQCRLLNIVGTFVLFLSYTIFLLARPDKAYGINMFFGDQITKVWGEAQLFGSSLLSLFAMALMGYTIVINTEKNAIKTYSVLLFVLAVIAGGMSLFVLANKGFL